ncbi:MAG: hypothetical protein SPL42_02730 [Bacteroidales bacterium]|nr:hypothetical protein [Bacteroidales bacterium]MDY6347334.1 hypothetical protein [Bacteroidales bacterium]
MKGLRLPCSGYRRAFRRHRVTYKEYMYSHEFRRMNEAGHDGFFSTLTADSSRLQKRA